MSVKRRRKSIHKLKSSFVATFSTFATGLGACGVAEQPESRVMEENTGGVGGVAGDPSVAGNPPGFSGVGGVGGTIAGGAGGSIAGYGGYGANPPPPPQPTCPAEPPLQGYACEGGITCVYEDPFVDPCGFSGSTRAECNNGVWTVIVEQWSCNPPFDAGIIDEDAGQE